MANTPKNRMPAQNLQADIDTYLALKAINGYKPYDNTYALETVGALHDKLRTAQEAEIHAQNVAAAARDALVALQWNFHDLILGVKSQVKALYGPDSDEVAALGAEEKVRTQIPAAGEQGCGGGVVRKMVRPLRKRGRDGEEGNGDRGLGRRWCVWGGGLIEWRLKHLENRVQDMRISGYESTNCSTHWRFSSRNFLALTSN